MGVYWKKIRKFPTVPFGINRHYLYFPYYTKILNFLLKTIKYFNYLLYFKLYFPVLILQIFSERPAFFETAKLNAKAYV